MCMGVVIGSLLVVKPPCNRILYSARACALAVTRTRPVQAEIFLSAIQPIGRPTCPSLAPIIS